MFLKVFSSKNFLPRKFPKREQFPKTERTLSLAPWCEIVKLCNRFTPTYHAICGQCFCLFFGICHLNQVPKCEESHAVTGRAHLLVDLRNRNTQCSCGVTSCLIYIAFHPYLVSSPDGGVVQGVQVTVVAPGQLGRVQDHVGADRIIQSSCHSYKKD